MRIENDPCCMLHPLGNATCNKPQTSTPADATPDATTPLKAAATLVLERNKRCNKGATTTQKVMQQTTPENDPDCCLIRDMVIPPAAHLKDSIPDDGPRAEIWRLYLDSGDQVDAIRGRPMTLAEVLTEFPGERVVAAQPRLSKGESIQVGEDKT
jgi:hypothetical protein